MQVLLHKTCIFKMSVLITVNVEEGWGKWARDKGLRNKSRGVDSLFWGGGRVVYL